MCVVNSPGAVVEDGSDYSSVPPFTVQENFSGHIEHYGWHLMRHGITV